MRRNYGHLNLLALEKCSISSSSDLTEEEEHIQEQKQEEKVSCSVDHLRHTSTHHCIFREEEEDDDDDSYGFLEDILENDFESSEPVSIINSLKDTVTSCSIPIETSMKTSSIVTEDSEVSAVHCRTTSSSFTCSSPSVSSSSLMSPLSISLRDEEDFLSSIEPSKRLCTMSSPSSSSPSSSTARTTAATTAFMAQHQKQLQALRCYTMQMMFATSTQLNGASKMKGSESDDIFFFEPERRRPSPAVASASTSVSRAPAPEAAPWRNIIQTV